MARALSVTSGRARRVTRTRALAPVLAAVLGAAVLAGCSGDGPPPDLDGGAVTPAEATRLLDARAEAILGNDLDAFLEGLDRKDEKLLDRQRRYFANLQELPLRTLRYEVLKSAWPAEFRAKRWGTGVLLPQVRISTQLEAFDTVPISRVSGFAIGRRDGRVVVVSELTGKGKQFPGSGPAPWDLVKVRVQRTGSTLQVFDDTTWSRRGQVATVMRDAVREVEDGLPFVWDGRVVVYVFARPAVLDSYEGVPGGNIRHLGAMTFPMYAVLGQEQVAGIRFTLLPSSLRAGGTFLDRITRHELTHVALGERDDGTPVWLAEGIAEYMSARTLDADDRRIATVAVKRARAGVPRMPSSASFNGPDQSWHYALAWMACDYIAETQGESRLWQLMDELHDAGAGTTDSEQDPVLERVLGMDSGELAGHAADRILEIYG